ncbi:hypothetical protein [Kitasatospora sp. NPDC058190]|uniref:hypothetical protein n=1 Tax=Kitasatospora sp. NPDC058190 TaxID=3346371 RepID=UPI0036DBCF3B
MAVSTNTRKAGTGGDFTGDHDDGSPVSLREIALREPAKSTVDADKCPSCLWFDAMEREAYKDPAGVDHSRLTDVRVLRRRHAESEDCLNPGDAE